MDTRALWMTAWKASVEGNNIHFIVIQETHVGSASEALDLQVQWARMWGKRHDANRPLSFWSTADSATIGVAILIRPDLDETFSLLPPLGQHGRMIAIASASTTIVNIYAPNDRTHRERFFMDLATTAPARAGKWLLAGDFNCVLDPTRDRVTTRATSSNPESSALWKFVQDRALVDTITLMNDNLQCESELRLTHFQPNSDHGARLDRCYIAATAREWVTGTQILVPKVLTDHLGFVTWLRDPQLRPKQRPLPPLLYPIYGRDPDAIQEEVEAELRRILLSPNQEYRSWDETLLHIGDALTAIKRREKKRARRSDAKWARRARARINSRQDLIEHEQACLERTIRRRRGKHLLDISGDATAILRRLNRHERFIIKQIDGPAHLSIADKFGTTWATLLTASHATVAAEDREERVRRLFTIPDEHRLSAADNGALLAPTTVEEVEATIAELGKHKASGADRLNNDFYRDWAPLLAPTLTREFNQILGGAAMPRSFGAAVVVPLPKKGRSTDAMDYRPISLLQTSYKIFTKLLASRVQHSLGRVINADQNGFVRGRDMANNIFLMQSILEQEHTIESTEAEDAPVAVLLDFKKAYDTLDRDFLHQALVVFGYDSNFVDLISRLHEGTTARFLANGDLSSAIDVRTGIRQGCPLAPLLFLIAVETLKYAIVQTPGVQGIDLKSAGAEFTHSFSAFVDDSVVFVAEGRMLAAVEATLAAFAAVSGLQVQPAKSHAIVMATRCTATSIGIFPIVPLGVTVTYLGVEVGLGDTGPANWTKRMEKLRASLGKASSLVTSLADRTIVLNVVGLPSILFTAKYSSPAPTVLAELDGLWRRFLWHGTITTTAVRAHKIAQPILELPRRDLGLGLRNFREAMTEQAAQLILSWNVRGRDKYWAAFHNLLRSVIPTDTPILHCSPSASAVLSARVADGRAHLLHLGWIRVTASLCNRYPVPPAITQLKQDALKTAPADVSGLQWLSSRDGSLTLPATAEVDWPHVSTMVYASKPHEIRSFWPSFRWADNPWIVDASGKPLRRSDFPGIRITTIAELELRPNEQGSYSFRNPCVTAVFRLRSSQRVHLVRWLHIIIGNTGFHLADSASWRQSRVYSCNGHPIFDKYEWHFTTDPTSPARSMRGRSLVEKWQSQDPTAPMDDWLTAEVHAWGEPVLFLTAHGPTRVHDDLRSLQDEVAGPVILAGHPALHHGPNLYIPKPRLTRAPSKRELRNGLRSAVAVGRRREAALRLLADRLSKSQARDPDLQMEMRARPMAAIYQRAEGETDYQAVFRYRLVMGALNLRDNSGLLMDCPHAWCALPAQDMSLTHIVWQCPAARRTWTLVYQQWTRRQALQDSVGRLRSSLGPDAPVLAREVRRSLAEDFPDEALVATTVTQAWKIIQAAVPHQLWLKRNAAAFTEAQDSVHAVAATVWATAMHQVDALAAAKRTANASSEAARVLAALVTALQTDIQTDRSTPTEVRLYYDGGARGNPGPSGAGSLLVERTAGDDEWIIVWWAATYLGDSHTNNVAEHTALAQGLTEAARRYGHTRTKLTIIGDSLLATHQLKNRFRVRTSKLAKPLRVSRHGLVELYDYTFHHSLRTGNKAADWLANAAMDATATTDSKTAPPPTHRSTMTELHKLVASDTRHAWTVSSYHDILAIITATADTLKSQLPPVRKRPRPTALTTTAPAAKPPFHSTDPA